MWDEREEKAPTSPLLIVEDTILSLVDRIRLGDAFDRSAGVLQVEKVQLIDRRGAEGNILGTIHVTTTHFIFKSEQGNREIWVANNLIGSVERGPLSVSGCPLLIKCKHFQALHLLINRDKTCQDLFETLQKCAKPVNVNELLAFENRDGAEDAKGWNRFDWDIEFTRQGVDDKWAETTLNYDYSLCDTYPSRLWVPATATNQLLIASSKFRSKGRLPVLTYFHKSSQASLSRCAQPLTGFSARCVEDEKLMEQISATNEQDEELFLVDTRPMVNAMVNKVQGKGYEDEKNYSKIRFHFFDIENIHIVRNSQHKLVDACLKSRELTEFLRGVESSSWLRHLRSIQECSLFLASSISKGTSCVVHCSDGWDRTSQCVSLAQILLDPFFRTLHGLQVIIEKDWLAFGHKFDDRCAHVGALNDEAAKEQMVNVEVSPIFSQWLDVLWQVHRQFPRAFQFNERALIHLHEFVYSCQFGTFLGNCEKDRKDLHLSKRTKSLWSYMDCHMDCYINPFYDAQLFSGVLMADTRAFAFSVFTGLYNRFEDGVLPREVLVDSLSSWNEHIGVLESQIAGMKAKLKEVKEVLHKEGEELVSPEDSWTESEYSMVVEWQSLREANQCCSPICCAQLPPRGEFRLHCHRCGKIYCKRCIGSSSLDKERVCNICKED